MHAGQMSIRVTRCAHLLAGKDIRIKLPLSACSYSVSPASFVSPFQCFFFFLLLQVCVLISGLFDLWVCLDCDCAMFLLLRQCSFKTGMQTLQGDCTVQDRVGQPGCSLLPYGCKIAFVCWFFISMKNCDWNFDGCALNLQFAFHNILTIRRDVFSSVSLQFKVLILQVFHFFAMLGYFILLRVL